MPIDRETFLRIMSAFPTGVAIITTLDESGEPRGLTTNAVCSVSADPPLLLVCVDRTSRTLPALRTRGRFVVNFAREGRGELSQRFASKDEDKFSGVEWQRSSSGLPHLHADSAAYAECVTEQELEAGDHVVFIGRVEEGEPPHDTARTLVYFRRSYTDWPSEG